PEPGAAAPPWPAGVPPVDELVLPPAPVVGFPPLPELGPPLWLDDVHAASHPLAASTHNHRARVPRTVRRSPGLTGREHIPRRAGSKKSYCDFRAVPFLGGNCTSSCSLAPFARPMLDCASQWRAGRRSA